MTQTTDNIMLEIRTVVVDFKSCRYNFDSNKRVANKNQKKGNCRSFQILKWFLNPYKNILYHNVKLIFVNYKLTKIAANLVISASVQWLWIVKVVDTII